MFYCSSKTLRYGPSGVHSARRAENRVPAVCRVQGRVRMLVIFFGLFAILLCMATCTIAVAIPILYMLIVKLRPSVTLSRNTLLLLFFLVFRVFCCLRLRRRGRGIYIQWDGDGDIVESNSETCKGPFWVVEISVSFWWNSWDDRSCAMCSIEFEEEERIVCLLSCAHCYHRECIERWVTCQPNCPTCMEPLFSFWEIASALRRIANDSQNPRYAHARARPVLRPIASNLILYV